MAEPTGYDDDKVLAARPRKNDVDPFLPYAFFVEPECGASRRIEDVATVFLTNRECPLQCLMCDLWKNTTDFRVPFGAIPQQIEHALNRLPATKHIKLYNSGNFFDHQAIPPTDLPSIASLLRSFETVIVENHPCFCNDDCIRFRDRLHGTLEVAMGLETVHPEILAKLNKRMTLADFERSALFLGTNGIRTRAFILLRPPYSSETEGEEWCLRSIRYAFDLGVDCCSIIPTRGGNGIMEKLQQSGHFSPPQFATLERVFESAIALERGRVFVDLWDVQRLTTCTVCSATRIARLQQMNLHQTMLPRVECTCSEV